MSKYSICKLIEVYVRQKHARNEEGLRLLSVHNLNIHTGINALVVFEVKAEIWLHIASLRGTYNFDEVFVKL